MTLKKILGLIIVILMLLSACSLTDNSKNKDKGGSKSESEVVAEVEETMQTENVDEELEADLQAADTEESDTDEEAVTETNEETDSNENTVVEEDTEDDTNGQGNTDEETEEDNEDENDEGYEDVQDIFGNDPSVIIGDENVDIDEMDEDLLKNDMIIILNNELAGKFKIKITFEKIELNIKNNIIYRLYITNEEDKKVGFVKLKANKNGNIRAIGYVILEKNARLKLSWKNAEAEKKNNKGELDFDKLVIKNIKILAKRTELIKEEKKEENKEEKDNKDKKDK